MTRDLVTADAQRPRAIGQILLLAAGLLVLVAISASSVVLVNESRKDNARVVHTVEVENQLSTLLLQIRRAESAARGLSPDVRAPLPERTRRRQRDHPRRRRQACPVDP